MILNDSQVVSAKQAQLTHGVAVELTIECILRDFRVYADNQPDWGTLHITVTPSGGDILVVSASVGGSDE